MSNRGFAVIDTETTGFSARGQRIAEIAVVHVDESGRITGRWDTLVNPHRDLGAQSVHGIRASDAMDAPDFAQIAERLLELLRGRVIVAHNAPFDLRFLLAELERAGCIPDTQPVSLCTMQLASELLPQARRSLAACCDAVGIQLADAHRASADAEAAAELLGVYLASTSADTWTRTLDLASACGWPAVAGPVAQWRPRPDRREVEPHFLQRIARRLPDRSGPEHHRQYRALLDAALLDRVVSVHETRALIALAAELGIDRMTAEHLHAEYLADVVAVAYADGVVSDDERADLDAVASLLGLGHDAVQRAVDEHPADRVNVPTSVFALSLGDRVVLTGDMRRPRAEWEALLTASGYTPSASVTKRVQLVVAADPDSLSGKARKARDYGIPIVDEHWLERNLSSTLN